MLKSIWAYFIDFLKDCERELESGGTIMPVATSPQRYRHHLVGERIYIFPTKNPEARSMTNPERHTQLPCAATTSGHAMTTLAQNPPVHHVREGGPCNRPTWLVAGKLFTIHINQEVATEHDARSMLDELCASANTIASGAQSFRDMAILPFVLDDDHTPSCILGFARNKENLDIRVAVYPPFTGLQIRSKAA